MVKVAIVGAGVMGTAMSYPLADNGHEVRLVGTHLDGDIIHSCRQSRYHPRLRREIPPSVQPFFVEDIEEALDGVDLVVSGVNSYGVHWVGQTIGPHLRPGQRVIAVTKGLEAAPDGDLVILPDVLASELPKGLQDQVTVAAIGGPCIAGELAGRRASCVMFGSRRAAVAQELAALFRTPYYHIWTTTDLVGLEVCAALKNSYALGVGLAQGLLERAGGVDVAGAHMHNLAAALFAQSCVEMDRVLELMGATRTLAFGLPGAGDLYVTCQGGRNVRLGRLLGLGHTFAEAQKLMAGETLEGAETIRTLSDTLPRLEARGRIGPHDLPLMRNLIDVVANERTVDLSLVRFFL